MPNPHPAGSRERGLWMLADSRADQPSDYTLAGRVAGRLGVNPGRAVVEEHAGIDAGQQPGTTPDAHWGIKRSRKQIAAVGFGTARGYRAAKTHPASAMTLSDQSIGTETTQFYAGNDGHVWKSGKLMTFSN